MKPNAYAQEKRDFAHYSLVAGDGLVLIAMLFLFGAATKAWEAFGLWSPVQDLTPYDAESLGWFGQSQVWWKQFLETLILLTLTRGGLSLGLYLKRFGRTLKHLISN